MSGDYETLEINQPKISYFHKNIENNKEWFIELINTVDEVKKKYLSIIQKYKMIFFISLRSNFFEKFLLKIPSGS